MRHGPAAQHLCCWKPAELMATATCRAATAALGGQGTYYSHLPLEAPGNADQPQPWQWPQASGPGSWVKIWVAPAPLPGHNRSPRPADLPPWCCGHRCCPLHGPGHRGAQQAGLLGRRSHRLSPLRRNRQPPHVRDRRVSVGHSPL